MAGKDKMDRNLNTKVSPTMLKEVQEYIGKGTNLSKIIRKFLNELIEKEKSKTSPHTYCFCCDTHQATIKDMFLVPVGDYEKDYYLLGCVCSKCFEEMVRTSLDEFKEKTKLLGEKGVKDSKNFPYCRKLMIKFNMSWDGKKISDAHFKEAVVEIRKCMLFQPDYAIDHELLVKMYPESYKILLGRFLIAKKLEEEELLGHLKMIEKLIEGGVSNI